MGQGENLSVDAVRDLMLRAQEDSPRERRIARLGGAAIFLRGSYGALPLDATTELERATQRVIAEPRTAEMPPLDSTE